MSSSPDSKPQRRNKSARTEDDKPNQRTPAGTYEVGYGKPPVSTRFVKGQSGNPRGRPRKYKPQPPRLSDAPSDRYLQEEAYRSVALRENGQAVDLPTTKAVLRALAMSAIKGNRLSQKYFLEYVTRREELHLQLNAQNYARLQMLKREGEKTLAEHERKGLPPPDLLPHPEDIVLRPATGDAYVNGPETPEDVHYYEHAVRLRDHALLCSTHAYERRRKSLPKPENGGVCMLFVIAQVLNMILPPRYRWKDDADFFIMMEYSRLTKRERERRIAAEFAQLNATKPRLSWITPEMEWEIQRIVNKNMRSQDAPQHEGVVD